MSRQQVLAALLILFGPELAPHFVINLSDEEVRQVSSEMNRIELLSSEMSEILSTQSFDQ